MLVDSASGPSPPSNNSTRSTAPGPRCPNKKKDTRELVLSCGWLLMVADCAYFKLFNYFFFFLKLVKLCNIYISTNAHHPHSLPSPLMTNPDLVRLLKSDEIQKAIRAPIKEKKKRILKRNPLKNAKVTGSSLRWNLVGIVYGGWMKELMNR